MLNKPTVSTALEELRKQGKVEVAGGAWTLITNRKKGSTNVTPSPKKKAPAKKVAAKKVPAKKAPAKKVAVKTTPMRKAVAAQKARKAATKSVAALNGAKKHAKVAERDNKVLSIIAASKKKGITDEEVAKAIGAPLGIAYHSIRRLKDEDRVTSAKGENGVTRRYA